MGGTRIVVLQLKELIRTGIFAILGLLLIIALIWFLVPKNKSANAAVYTPGTYAAQIVLHNKPINIEVTVTDKEITGIEMKDMVHVQEVFYPLFKPTMDQLTQEVLRSQTTENIKSTAENAVTAKVLLDAINVALSQAREAQAVAK